MKFAFFFLILIYSFSSMAEEACSTDFLGVNLNGFIGETIKEVAKKEDCEAEFKKIRFNSIDGQRKNDYCSCIENSKSSLYARNLGTIKADPSYIESKKKAEKELAKNYAKALRGKIFGIVSRSFKLDNLAKRGFLTNSLARDYKENKCQIDKVLEGMESFGKYEEKFSSCTGKSAIFNERKQMLFPEGYEKFLNNLKDVSNSVAKGVRTEGSCLTYQNYLELNSTIPTNSEGVKILATSANWEDFKAKIAKEMDTFDKYKKRLNAVRSTNNNSEVAERLSGFSGIENRGRDIYRLVKSNPSFELALRDKKFFEKMQAQFNMFENKASNGGFIGGEPRASADDFFKDRANELMKPHLEACYSESKNTKSGEMGGGGASTLGLNQTIAKFLCDENLPVTRPETIEGSLGNSLKGANNSDLLGKVLSSDLVCINKKSPKAELLSDIDPLLSVDSDLDINSENFLKDYKDFSSSFCKLISPDCSDPQKAKSNPKCEKLSSMAQTALANSLTKYAKEFLVPAKEGDSPHFTMMNIIMSSPQISSEDAFQDLKKYLDENYPNKISNKDLAIIKEQITTLRPHVERISMYKDINKLGEVPNNGEPLSRFFRTKEGVDFLKNHKSDISNRILGTLADDTNVNLKNDITVSNFADVFINGHTSNADGSPAFASKGPALDNQYYSISTQASPSEDQLPSRTIATWSDETQDSKNIARGGIRSLDDLLPTTPKNNKDIVIVSSPDTPKGQNDTKKASAPSDTGETRNSKSWSNTVEQIGLTRTTKDSSEDTQGSRFNYDTRLSYESVSLSKSSGSERIGGFGKMFDSNQSEKEKILAEIRDLESKIKEKRDGHSTNNDEISNAENINNQLKRRVADLENQINNNSNYNNHNSRNFDNQNYGSNNNDTDSNGNNNIDPRDPFSRVDTSREITADHMDAIDPAGQSAKSGGGGSGKKAIGLSKNKTSTPESEADLGGKSTKRRKPASAEYELDPELICGFEQQELNCIFEHSEIFARYKKDQIKSLVEGLLLHGHSFKTIEMFRNRDPNIPNEYVIHYFEPAKNLSNEDKMAQFELVKKMMTDYKKNYSFLKAIASKVVRTKSIKINKKEAFSKMKNTLKRPDIDKLLIRRLKLIERLPANTKK